MEGISGNSPEVTVLEICADSCTHLLGRIKDAQYRATKKPEQRFDVVCARFDQTCNAQVVSEGLYSDDSSEKKQRALDRGASTYSCAEFAVGSVVVLD